MDYVRSWCQLITSPKWQALSYRARVVIHQAWMYAGLHETRGYVPDSARKFIDWSPAVESELEGAWWHRNGSGWQIHDWADHQVDADEIRAKRERARELDKQRKAAKRAAEKGAIT
jgi:hypothetical protein